jgi:chitinase
MKKTLTFLALAAALSGPLIAQTPCKEVVGYYPNWQWYDRNKLVDPFSIDYSRYTILEYAFFKPEANGSISNTDAWADENLLQGQIDWSTNPPGHFPNTSLVDRAHAAGVNVLASVGGWTLSYNFPAIAASNTFRAQFAHECNRLVSFYNFDGIDIDWEYPGYAPNGGTPADYANYTLLLQQIRDSLDALEISAGEQYLLTAAVSASAANSQNIQWNLVEPELDMLNVMTYDFYGAWDAVANHNSPLYASACGDPSFNLQSAFTMYTTQYNVPAGKLNLGLAFYGRSQTGYTALCQPTSGNAATADFPPDGVPLFYEIRNSIAAYSYNWDNTAHVPYLTGNGIFCSYDDERSIGEKAAFIVNNNARGAIIWEITGDYVETAPGSGIIAGTPLADTINAVFCAAPLSAGQNANDPQTTVFPNPAKNELFFHFTSAASGPVVITLFDLSGRIVLRSTQDAVRGENQFRLDCAPVPPGSYFLRLEDAAGSRADVPVVLTK